MENDFDGTNDEVNANNRMIDLNGLFKDPIVLENNFKNLSARGLQFKLINGIRMHRNKFYLNDSTTIPQVIDFFNTCTGILIANDNEIFGNISKITYFMSLATGSAVEETLTRNNYPALYGRDFKNSESNSPGFRPTARLAVGQPFFDTSLGKTIWWNGSAWKDANGTTV